MTDVGPLPPEAPPPVPTTYAALVRERFEARLANVVESLPKASGDDLLFTIRQFADCLDDDAKRRLLPDFTEYLEDDELRKVLADFAPAYTAHAIEEVERLKAGGERFDPPFLTQEEYQEMPVREKWRTIAAHPSDVPPLQLRREVARLGLLFRPYMLEDPGFNESVLEFALYFDLLDRLRALSDDEVRGAAIRLAPLVEEAAALSSQAEACEAKLAELRAVAAEIAGLPSSPESLLGDRMERYPRNPPPGWTVRAMKKVLGGMSLPDLRASALVHIDLLTADEFRAVVLPFVSRFKSFRDVPGNALRELILAIAEAAPTRELTAFAERFASGRLAMGEPVPQEAWSVLPRDRRLLLLFADNAFMDVAMIARHLARVLHSPSFAVLLDAGRQVALLSDPAWVAAHGKLLATMGADGPDGAPSPLRTLYDEWTEAALDAASANDEATREAAYIAARARLVERVGSMADR